MTSMIQLKQTTSAFLVALGFACFGLSPAVQAVSPAPDGGYSGANTAEGTGALFSLTTGSNNTALGTSALASVTGGVQNTATGAQALKNNTGNANTADGFQALVFNKTGSQNVAVGWRALFQNTVGVENTATGYQALFHNIDGFDNVADGTFALLSNTGGENNTASGVQALQSNTTGNNNTAIGDTALLNNTTGNGNTALGISAGFNQTTGSGNVYIGDDVNGVAGENGHTYISNINNTTVSGGGTDTVTIDLSTGLLGHPSSSRRYKEDVKPMDDASEKLYRLKPVSYRYKKEIDRSQVRDYGLIAEDVAEIDPSLAVRNKEGQIESVRYTAINAMLLNEFLKEHRKVQNLEAALDAVNKRLEKQDAKIAELHVSKPPVRIVSNSQ